MNSNQTVVIVKHGTLAIIGNRKVTFGTAAGYEEQSLRQYTEHTKRCAVAAEMSVEAYIAQNVAEAVRRARKFGHALRWINLEAVCLVNDPRYYEEQRRIWESAPRLSAGDVVVLDGDVFTIENAPNGNFTLVQEAVKSTASARR